MIAIMTIVIIVSYFLIKGKKQTPQSQVSSQQVETETQKQTPAESEVGNVQPDIQKPLPKEVEGKIVGITPTSLIIEQKTGALTVGFDLNGTPVYKGTKKAKASTLDLKVGVEVTAAIDQSTNRATEIMVK